MREIKFRAWDKERLLWLEINSIDFESKKIYLKGGEIRNFSKVNVVEYTGSKDCKGVEIYEGDLIKNKSGRICKVVWDNWNGGWDATPMIGIGDWKGFNVSEWKEFTEIIGNIHENSKY